MLEAGWATPESLKDTERELRAFVDKEFAKAKTGCVALTSRCLPYTPLALTLASGMLSVWCCALMVCWCVVFVSRKPPAPGELYTDIYYKELPPFIRGVEIETSVVA